MASKHGLSTNILSTSNFTSKFFKCFDLENSVFETKQLKSSQVKQTGFFLHLAVFFILCSSVIKEPSWNFNRTFNLHPEIFLGFEIDLDFSRPWFSEIRVQIKRSNFFHIFDIPSLLPNVATVTLHQLLIYTS